MGEIGVECVPLSTREEYPALLMDGPVLLVQVMNSLLTLIETARLRFVQMNYFGSNDQ